MNPEGDIVGHSAPNKNKLSMSIYVNVMSKMIIIMDSEGSVESQSCILSLVSLLNSVLGHFRDYKMLQAARSQAFAVHSDQCGGGIPSLGRAKHEKTWALNQASKWFHDSLSWPDCISIHKESRRGGLLPAVQFLMFTISFLISPICLKSMPTNQQD